MDLSFRLKKVLAEHSVDGHGVIQRIADTTHLKRHTVAKIYHNRVRYLSLDALARICDFLIEHARVDPALLPGILFEQEHGDLMNMLARRGRFEVCVGVRDVNDISWVQAADATLQGRLAHEVSRVWAALHARERHGDDRPDRALTTPVPPMLMEQHLIHAPTEDGHVPDIARKQALDLHRTHAEVDTGDRALVCLGSARSNPVTEVVIARSFGATAFAGPDETVRCPFYLCYPTPGAHPPSCCAGATPPDAMRSPQTGLYLDEGRGAWTHCAVDDRHDVALVHYRYAPTIGRLDLVLGGFSSRATLLLAQNLDALRADDLAPTLVTGDVQAAAIAVQFELDAGGRLQEIVPRRVPAEVLDRTITVH